jgi:hypothetical protein
LAKKSRGDGAKRQRSGSSKSLRISLPPSLQHTKSPSRRLRTPIKTTTRRRNGGSVGIGVRDERRSSSIRTTHCNSNERTHGLVSPLLRAYSPYQEVLIASTLRSATRRRRRKDTAAEAGTSEESKVARRNSCRRSFNDSTKFWCCRFQGLDDTTSYKNLWGSQAQVLTTPSSLQRDRSRIWSGESNWGANVARNSKDAKRKFEKPSPRFSTTRRRHRF